MQYRLKEAYTDASNSSVQLQNISAQQCVSISPLGVQFVMLFCMLKASGGETFTHILLHS